MSIRLLTKIKCHHLFCISYHAASHQSMPRCQSLYYHMFNSHCKKFSNSFIMPILTFHSNAIIYGKSASETSDICEGDLTSEIASSATTKKQDIDISNHSAVPNNVLYMRGLPYTVSVDDVIEFFKVAGVIPWKVLLMHDQNGQTNGNAEVLFENSADVAKARNRHFAHMGKRYIELSVTPFSSMNAERKSQKYLYKTSSDDLRENSSSWVKLRGLPYTTTGEDIRKFFEPLQITPINIVFRYNKNGKPTGFCDVEFKSSSEATLATEKHKSYIGERYIEVLR